VYPSGIVSIVSDQYDLWKVMTDYVKELKPYIMARDGKVVFRPDSGDPVRILCGDRLDLMYKTPESKGVIQLLWETFGGTINSKGYKELDPHVGAIYGDSISIDRAKTICQRLKDKGFASTNVVFGIGSYTYQHNTRDTFGFALKSTYVQINGKGIDIFKDPVTDDGVKKSAVGLVKVVKEEDGFKLIDGVSSEEEETGELKTVFLNGVIVRKSRYSEVIKNLKNC
jgi:nicotinamide phosphoribosyltransferase